MLASQSYCPTMTALLKLALMKLLGLFQVWWKTPLTPTVVLVESVCLGQHPVSFTYHESIEARVSQPVGLGFFGVASHLCGHSSGLRGHRKRRGQQENGDHREQDVATEKEQIKKAQRSIFEQVSGLNKNDFQENDKTKSTRMKLSCGCLAMSTSW